MLDGVVVRVCQACEVGSLVGQGRVSVVEPYLSAGLVVEIVDEDGRGSMELLEDGTERLGVLAGMSHEVVVIRENGPGLQLPTVAFRSCQKLGLEMIQSFGTSKVVCPVERASGHKERALGAEAVRRRVRPVEWLNGGWCWLGRGCNSIPALETVEQSLDFIELIGCEMENMLNDL